MSETIVPFSPQQPISVTLQAQDWNVVLAGLYELPAKNSLSVINRLNRQLIAQQPSARVPVEDGVESPR